MRKTIGRIGARGYRSEEGTTSADKTRLTEMLVARTPPGGKTEDGALMEGFSRGQQFESTPEIGDAYVALTRQQDPNFNPKGKVYQNTLARFPGDPRAWVESAADVKRAAQLNNMVVRGAVNCEGPDVGPSAPTQIADDIVWDGVADRCKADPDLANRVRTNPEKRKEVFAEVKKEASGEGLYEKVE